jgi:hypothetical protein
MNTAENALNQCFGLIISFNTTSIVVPSIKFLNKY